nr:uroporphyrinogen decarboxylase family protein [Halobacterium sp. R2-5]
MSYLRGRQSKPRPYVPIVGQLAANVSQLPPEIFLSNATQQTNALQSSQRLFESDVVFTGVDTALLAEALGASVEWDAATEQFETAEPIVSSDAVSDPTTVTNRGRVPTVIDVGERLVSSLDEPLVVGVVPGPLTTIETTFGNAAALDAEYTKPVRTAIGELGRAFGKAGVDAILVYEDVGQLNGGEAAEAIVETLQVLDNITGFYDTPLMLAPNGYDETTVDIVLDQGEPAAALLDTDDPAAVAVEHPDVRIGGGITANLLDAEPSEITARVEERCRDLPASAFLASGRELPSDVHPNALHAVREGYTDA